MLGFLASIFGSGVFGSLIGLVGNFLNQIQQKKQMAMKYKHEIDMATVQIDLLKAKTDASIKITQAQVQGAVDLQDSQAYTHSIKVGNEKTFSDKWMDYLLNQTGWLKYIAVPAGFILMLLFALVDVLKAFMRPGLTLYFTVLSTLITIMAYNILQTDTMEVITQTKALTIFMVAVDTAIMLTTTCVTWWFGDRRMAKFLMRMNASKLGINTKE